MKVIIASFKALPAHAKAMEAELKCLLQATGHEPGNQVYSIQQDLDDPLRWVVYEVYKDQAATDAHMKSSYLNAFLKKVSGMISEPFKVERLELHGAVGF